jgi:DNA repair protein RecO (recombination protein O)
MQWSSEALIIGTRRHGETSLIIEVMTEQRGRHLGLVRGGRSRRFKAMLQPGNSVLVNWRARLDEHLGAFTVEPLAQRAAALMESRDRLYLSQLVCEHLRLLPERDPHPRLYREALAMIGDGDDRLATAAALARFELHLLDDLGFGLDLESCAATGSNDNLIYVSPKTGRAVSASAGEPYRDKLLALPGFLIGEGETGKEAVLAGLRLTGHFLGEHVWLARQIEPPQTRDRLIWALL